MSLNISNYGQEREHITTETELAIFEIIKALVCCEDLRLVCKSDDYVSAVIGDWDLARFKYTARAKWIIFPVVEVGAKKHRIERPDDVREYAELLGNSIAHIKKYS